MKKMIIFSAVLIMTLFFFLSQNTQPNKPVTGLYPWQIDILAEGKTRVFGLILTETTLAEVDRLFGMQPDIAIYENKNYLTLEAYYKNVSHGGLIGSFIFTLDIPAELLQKIKKSSFKKKPVEGNELKYELDKPAAEQVKSFIVKDLIYIPTVQLDEKIIISRFGQPAEKIKLRTKEVGWHYLYPEKGLDLIFKEDGKEILQYAAPKNFNLLLEPLQSR
jgi:hypothetical protein